VAPEIVEKLTRDEGVLIAPGKVLYARVGGPIVDHSAFTALRAERLPLEDAEVEAEIERLKALPRAEYEAERERAASRLGLRLSVLDRLRSDGATEDGGKSFPNKKFGTAVGLVKGQHAQRAVAANRPLTTTDRIAKKKAAEEKLFDWLIEESHAHPECKQPELFEKAQQIWGERILTRAIWRRVVARPGLERLRRAGRPLG
jgi:hypothetical protein